MDQIQELEALIQSGDFSEALNRIEAMPQTERSRWQILNLTGIVCLYCGQPEQAETFFGDALRQEPDNPEILYNLAECCVCLEKYRKAEELLCRCEQVSNEDAIKEDIAALRERISSAQGGRVLMAAYYFPPLSGSGVFRSLKFAKYLPLFGWQPTVISTDRPPNGWNFADDSLTAEIPSDVEVIRIPDLINTNRADSLSMERIQAVLQFLHGILRHSPEADQIFSQMTRSPEGIAQLFRFPCVMLSWAYDVVQYIEKNMDLDKFRVIYTTSGPSSAHLIGFYMKQKYGIPWVADYRDPWTFNAYGAEYDAANPKQKLLFELESVLLHQADCNLTVEKDPMASYGKQFGLTKERIVSITNGYDEEDFSLLTVPEKRTEKFTINYSGLLYTQQRSVVPVLEALQQLFKEKKLDPEKVSLRVVGYAKPDKLKAAEPYRLEKNIIYTGYVSHQEALQSNLDANLLLLLVGNEEKFKPVYTGKIFEYLRSGRPILALAPKGGVVDQVLRESGHGQAFLSTQTDKIKKMIWQEYQKWRAGEQSELLHSPHIEKFERKVLTKRLAQIFNSVKNGSKEIVEIPSEIYNAVYKSGGANGNYHKHYSQSFYYPSWKEALKLLRNVDRTIPILEIGCGVGQFANMLFDYGFTNYTGFDYAAEAVTLAKKNNSKQADHFFVADAFQTELIEGQYGLIICFEVLEHIQKDLELLQHIRSGTHLLLSVPNFNDPYHVRYFGSTEEVRERYQQVMRISDIHISRINEHNCLYYVLGEKL